MKKKLRQLIPSLFFVAVGAICGLLAGRWLGSMAEGADLKSTLLRMLGALLMLYGVIYIQLIVHEAGHLVFGLLSGYSFSSFRIGSLMWIKTGGRIRLRRFALAGTGGQCLMAPPELKDGKIPAALYNLGGAAMNVIFSLLLLIVYSAVDRDGFFALLLLSGSLTGLVIAAMNGIPMHIGVIDNDGQNALSLKKDPKAVRCFWIQMKCNALLAAGIRVKDMPEEWFEVPSDDDMKNGMIAPVGVLACSRLLDEHRFSEAAALMDRLCSLDSGMVGLHRSLLVCDRVCCELLGDGDERIISALMTKPQKKFMKSMKNYISVIRTEYFMAQLHEKEGKKASDILRRFEKAAGTYPYEADLALERELIAIADEKAAK